MERTFLLLSNVLVCI